MSQVRSVPPASDEGVAEIVGTLLTTAITILIATGFASVMFHALPAPPDPLATDLVPALQDDVCPWGGGNEHVLLHHRGGDALPASVTTVRVTTTSGTHEWTGAALGDAFSDGALRIDEVWRSPPITVPAGALVIVETSVDGMGTLYHSAEVRAEAACGGP